MNVVEGVPQRPRHSRSVGRPVEVRSEIFDPENQRASAKPSRCEGRFGFFSVQPRRSIVMERSDKSPRRPPKILALPNILSLQFPLRAPFSAKSDWVFGL